MSRALQIVAPNWTMRKIYLLRLPTRAMFFENRETNISLKNVLGKQLEGLIEEEN